MRLIFGLVLLVGLGLAGAAVYMARGYIGDQQARLAEAELAKRAIVPTTEVYVLNKPMRYGQRLTPEDVELVRWPVKAIPEGAFTTQENAAPLFPEGEPARSILRSMEPKEAVMAVKVTEPGQDAGVSSRLSPGMRAVAIQTDVTSGVSGFLRPGDRVDVYWTGQGAGGRQVTKLIDVNMKLIAINQSADEDINDAVIARTVTVEASPNQAGRLVQAQSTGRLSLSLVGADDAIIADAVEIDQKELLGIEEQIVVEAPKEEVCTVRTRRGAEMIDIPIPCTN